MNDATYSAFSRAIHERHFGRRAPVEVSIEVTRRCPLECLHCYNNLPMGDSAARGQEMTLEEHCRLLDELVEAGTLWILYTGGEIFGRKDFLEIYTEAKKRGFLVTLFTNGTLITPRIADHLVEWRPFGIEITLYGATRETYEALTRVPGSYDRCMRGIRLLAERNLPLKLKTVPTTINVHEVYEMKRMAEEEFHVEFKFDPLVNPRIDCSRSPLAVRLSPEDAVALDFREVTRAEEYGKLLDRELGASIVPTPDDNHRYFCGGGMNGCAIDPTGNMSICVISHQQDYSIRSKGFREGWEGRLLEIRNQPRTRPTICDRCQIKSICGMCPANGELENGDPESPVDFLCQVAHLRAYALGYDVPEHGDCRCCNGGEKHQDLVAAGKRIQKRMAEAQPMASLETPAPLLNVLQPAGTCGSGGCGSCAATRT
ncbi:MAG TPA: radical SAM protein [Candidatus Acidoferrales bacterium]|nr:radical SAM protein [Candidatus Acidoferrales bacterium]